MHTVFFKKIMTILTVIFAVLITPIIVTDSQVNVVNAASSTTTSTINETLNWLNNNLGRQVGGSVQCVATVKAYANKLGLSSPISNGNACDFATRALNPGWTRIHGGVPQSGDILVYTGGKYGHVAIYAGNNIIFESNMSDKNYGNNLRKANRSYNKSWYSKAEGGTKSYWGCIRPITSTNITSNPPSDPRLYIDKNVYTVGENINFVYSVNNSDRIAIPIDINGKRADFLNVSKSGKYSYKTKTPGKYGFYLYAENSAGNVSGKYMEVNVVSSAAPSDPRLYVDKASYVVGENINFIYSVNNANRIAIPIDINGKRAEFLNVSKSGKYSYKTKTPGKYGFYLYAENSAGNVSGKYMEVNVSSANVKR